MGMAGEDDDIVLPAEPELFPEDNKPPKKTMAQKLAESREFLKASRATRKRRGKYELQREIFDPKNPAHLESYRRFLMTGNWGNLRFHIEIPHNTVTETVTSRFCIEQLNSILGEPPVELAEAHVAWILGEDATKK
jgi:hypothetical protein